LLIINELKFVYSGGTYASQIEFTHCFYKVALSYTNFISG